MNHLKKVQTTLETLDLEFEILNLTQQQSIMGGSGGSSGGSTPSPAEALANSMFPGGGGTASTGGFNYGTEVSVATAIAS